MLRSGSKSSACGVVGRRKATRSAKSAPRSSASMSSATKKPFGRSRGPTACFRSLRTSRRASKQEVLLIYKYQPYVEKRHALFKTELEVAPVYLKKPSRVAGLLHATYLAMIVDALIERTVRQAMKHLDLETLPILPEGRATKTPTTARLLERFTDVAWYEFDRGGEAVTFPVQLSPLQKQLLRLLDMDPSNYA